MPKFNTCGRFGNLDSDCVRIYATVVNVMESNSAPEAMMNQKEAEEAATSLREAPSVPVEAAIATGVGCAAPLIVMPPDVVEDLPGFPVETPTAVAILNAPPPRALSSVVEYSQEAPDTVDEGVATPPPSEATQEVARQKPTADVMLKESKCCPFAVPWLVGTVAPH